MRTLFATVLPMLVLSLGCARGSVPPETPETLAATVRGPIQSAPRLAARHTNQGSGYVAPGVPAELRKPGDYVVFRFSGSYRKAPLKLSQRVISVEGARTTVDVVLAAESGANEAHLRVVFDRTPGATREIAQVTRIVGEREEPGTIEEYEKLMAETVVVPDRNDDTLGTEIVSASVGDRSLDCKKTSYRVAIGKRSAIMSTCTSDGFAWGDVGGEIKTDDGKVIYRAEVVESGTARAATAQK